MIRFFLGLVFRDQTEEPEFASACCTYFTLPLDIPGL